MYIYSRDRRGFFPGGSCFFVSTFTISEKSNIHVSKKAGCLLTIGLKSPAFAVYSFNLLIDQLLQLIYRDDPPIRQTEYLVENQHIAFLRLQDLSGKIQAVLYI